MPNWCYNSMKITGTISEITRFKQTCIRTVYENEQAQLDFNAIEPKPDFFGDNDAVPWRTPGQAWRDWSDRALGHRRERSRFPRDGRCAWLLRISF